MIRSQAITGSTDASWFTAIAGRQGGRWAEQHISAAFPQRAPARQLENLSELRDRGVINDDEFQTLRSRLGG